MTLRPYYFIYFKLFLILFLLSISRQTNGQNAFQYRYGGQYHDKGTRVIPTLDGNFIVTGYTESFGYSGNAFCMKVDTNGTILWLRDYYGINTESIEDIAELPDGNLLLCGYTYSYGSGAADAFVIKADSLGNIVWSKAYGDIFDDAFFKIIPRGNNGFYVAGLTRIVTTSQVFTSVVARMDSSGNIIWAKHANNDLIHQAKLIQTSDGSLIMGYPTYPNDKFTLWKFSQGGGLQWSYKYTPNPVGGGFFGFDIARGNQNQIYVYTSYSNLNTTAQEVDNILIKIDSVGTVISGKGYGGTYIDQANRIIQTSDGGTLLTGKTRSAGNGALDVSLIKLDTVGNIQWAKAYGSPWAEEPLDIYETKDKGFIFTGSSISTGNSYDSTKVMLMKTDSLGMSFCNTVSWSPLSNNQPFTSLSGYTVTSISLPSMPITWSNTFRSFNRFPFCPTTSIDENEPSKIRFQLFPNPTSDQIHYDIDGIDQPFSFDIFSMDGKHLYSETRNSESNIAHQAGQLDVSYLQNGIYFFVLKTKETELKQKFLIIK